MPNCTARETKSKQIFVASRCCCRKKIFIVFNQVVDLYSIFYQGLYCSSCTISMSILGHKDRRYYNGQHKRLYMIVWNSYFKFGEILIDLKNVKLRYTLES